MYPVARLARAGSSSANFILVAAHDIWFECAVFFCFVAFLYFSCQGIKGRQYV